MGYRELIAIGVGIVIVVCCCCGDVGAKLYKATSGVHMSGKLGIPYALRVSPLHARNMIMLTLD